MNWTDLPAELTREYANSLPAATHAVERGDDGFDHPVLGRIHFKAANWFQSGQPLKPLFDTLGNVQRPLGGPNPMLSMLLGGALGAGLGYGGGDVVGAALPSKYVDHDKLKRRLAILGGAAGVAIPAYLWARPAMQMHGIAGLTKSGEIASTVAAARDEFATRVEPDEMLHKMADAGAAFAPIVPVDRFNRLVLGDPYIPPALQAATMGLTAAASAARGGSPFVSPADIGRIAIGMGSGAVSGMIVGKTLGAIAGLTPEAQQRLQEAGLIAGLVRNVVPLAFP